MSNQHAYPSSSPVPHPPLGLTAASFTVHFPTALTAISSPSLTSSGFSSASPVPSLAAPSPPRHPHVVPLSSSTSSQTISAFSAPTHNRSMPSTHTDTPRPTSRVQPHAPAPLPFHMSRQDFQSKSTKISIHSDPLTVDMSSSPPSISSHIRSTAGAQLSIESLSRQTSSSVGMSTPVKVYHEKENQPPPPPPSTPLSLQSQAHLLLNLDDEDLYSKVKRRTALQPIINSSTPKHQTAEKNKEEDNSREDAKSDLLKAINQKEERKEKDDKASPLIQSQIAEKVGSRRSKRVVVKKEMEGKEEVQIVNRSKHLIRPRPSPPVDGNASEDDKPVQRVRGKEKVKAGKRASGSSITSFKPWEGASESRAAQSKPLSRKVKPKVSRRSNGSASPEDDSASEPFSFHQVSFAFPVDSLPFLSPFLRPSSSSSSSSSSSPVTTSPSPFTAEFFQHLKSSPALSFHCYLTCPASSLIQRVRFILYRDSYSQKELSRCIGLSPATLSPLLSGCWQSLKLLYVVKIKAWAANRDIIHMQRVLERMRSWGLDEKELERRCKLMDRQLQRWLLFDTSLEERTEIDHAVEGFIRQCQHSVDHLVEETVLQQFEKEWEAAEEAGHVNTLHPYSTVNTCMTAHEQQHLGSTVPKLPKEIVKQQIRFKSILQVGGKLKTIDRVTAALANSASSGEEKEEEEEEEEQKNSSPSPVHELSKEMDVASDEEVVILDPDGDLSRIRVKREPHSPSSTSTKRVRLSRSPRFDAQDEEVSLFGNSPTSEDVRKHLSGMSGHLLTRQTPSSAVFWSPRVPPFPAYLQSGRGAGGTFFYFDPNTDMNQVAEKWSIPSLPSLPASFSTSPSILASVDSAGTRPTSSTSDTSPPPRSTDLLHSPIGSPSSRRSHDLSLSALFTPTAFYKKEAGDSGTADITSSNNTSQSSDVPSLGDTVIRSTDVSAGSEEPSPMSGIATSRSYSSDGLSTPLVFLRSPLSSTGVSSDGLPLARALDLNEGEENRKHLEVSDKSDSRESREWADVMRSLSETPSRP